ncbi:unnamed protein product [Caenorhabditis auriculariae]|uniref:Uncharacterized protein n=1 Tax=Caenorhabditis auriculariae TaxID=2777116 RepID=A0A8S1HRL7_9PELO|nr:unnamed protein product [Caenorhabditis auriculariae]
MAMYPAVNPEKVNFWLMLALHPALDLNGYATVIKIFLVIFTLSGYILILWSVNRQKSAMTASATKKESHKNIVLQALPISIYSFILMLYDIILLLTTVDFSGGLMRFSYIILSVLSAETVLYIVFILMVLSPVILLPAVHAVFIFILIKCYDEDKKFASIIKIILVIFTLSGYILILWRVNREKSAMTTSIAKRESHKTIILQALPISIYSFVLIIYDIILLFALLDFMDDLLAVIIKIILTIFTLFGYTLILWSVNRQKSAMTTSASKNGKHETIVLQALPIAVYSLFAITIKIFLLIFTLSGYILILLSVNREKSAMTTSASKKESHKTIVLQALPIAIFSFIFFFYERLVSLSTFNEISKVIIFISHSAAFFLSGYVVPFSFIIGNPKKRRIFTSFSFRDCFRSNKIRNSATVQAS